jgi:hypothetical protein
MTKIHNKKKIKKIQKNRKEVKKKIRSVWWRKRGDMLDVWVCERWIV